MSGAELLDITTGNTTDRKSAIVKAMSEKNWDKVKELLNQRH
jgi:DnaJ-domain-containing protein 1